MTKRTKVIFRVWRDNGIVIALFPEVEADGIYCDSFEHVGQHATANYADVIRRSRLAKPEEYASLERELERAPYNYQLNVRTRR